MKSISNKQVDFTLSISISLSKLPRLAYDDDDDDLSILKLKFTTKKSKNLFNKETSL